MRIFFCLFVFWLLARCISINHQKESSGEPSFDNYITGHFMGELGTLPVGCDIEKVVLKNDSVTINGKAFDNLTKESFNIDVWVGSYIEKTFSNGYKDIIPSKRKRLYTTDNDGIFSVKFEIRKNDILIMDQVGYDPAIFKVYDYLKDSELMRVSKVLEP